MNKAAIKMKSNHFLMCNSCLFGFLISSLLVSCQVHGPADCLDEQKLPVFVNVSDNATFHIQTNESYFLHRIEVFRSFKDISRIIYEIHNFNHFSEFDPQDVYVLPYDKQYQDRALCVSGNVSGSLQTLYLTLTDIQPSDNGTYIIQSRYADNIQMYYILYVLGSPTTKLSVSPIVIQEGNSGCLRCLAISTTIPSSHNLPMFVSWYINDQRLGTSSRYRVEDNVLNIYSMTRADDGLVVECETREDKGLSSRTNVSMIMHWGPNPGLRLQPSNTYYHLQVGKNIPDIRCSADCKPECEVSWTKPPDGSIISSNGLMSLGSVTEITSGEYVCTATRQGTYNRASKSIFILLQERAVIKDSQNADASAIAAVGVAVSGVALLVSVGVLLVIVRHKICTWGCRTMTEKEGTAEESIIQNRVYEDLKGTRDMQESYDAVNLGAFDFTIDETRDQGTRDTAVYENSKLN